MRAASLATLLAVSLSACAHPAGSARIAECIATPSHPDGLFCDGEFIPWDSADPVGYVCHRLEEHEEYMRGCR